MARGTSRVGAAGFSLNEATLLEVVRICQEVEGLPLAIECLA